MVGSVARVEKGARRLKVKAVAKSSQVCCHRVREPLLWSELRMCVLAAMARTAQNGSMCSTGV